MKKKYYTKEDIFLSRMASILHKPQGVAKRMFSERLVTTIFVNTLVQSEAQTIKSLEPLQADVEKVSWAKNTYYVNNLDKKDLAQTQMYKKGYFNLANPSKILPTTILDVHEDDKILVVGDTLGSYVIQLANDLENKGEITSMLDDKSRVDKVNHIFSVFGVRNCKATYADPTNIGNRHEGHFNKVLVVPTTSNEGEIYLNGEKPLRFWSIKQARIYSKRQDEIITSAFKALKKGGTLIYATYTLEPEENEGVVTELLETKPTATVESIDLFKSEAFSEYKSYYKIGIKEWNDRKYSNHVSKTYRIMPSGKMMAAYIAKIVKT